MSVQAQRIPVVETPTYLGTVAADDQTELIKNVGANDLVVGGPDVTWASGYPFPVNKEIAVDLLLAAGDRLYAIAQSSGTTSTVAVLRVGA